MNEIKEIFEFIKIYCDIKRGGVEYRWKIKRPEGNCSGIAEGAGTPEGAVREALKNCRYLISQKMIKFEEKEINGFCDSRIYYFLPKDEKFKRRGK